MVRWLCVAAALMAAVGMSACGGDSSSGALAAAEPQAGRQLSAFEVNGLVAGGPASDWPDLSAESKIDVVERYIAVTDADAALLDLVIAEIDAAAPLADDGASLRDVLEASFEAAGRDAGTTLDTAACEQELGGLVAALEEINARLDVGLSYGDYADRVADASVAYERLRIPDLDPACVSQVGVFVEQALNRYLRAEGRWGDCIEDYECDTDSIDPALQRNWTRADELIDRAKTALVG